MKMSSKIVRDSTEINLDVAIKDSTEKIKRMLQGMENSLEHSTADDTKKKQPEEINSLTRSGVVVETRLHNTVRELMRTCEVRIKNYPCGTVIAYVSPYAIDYAYKCGFSLGRALSGCTDVVVSDFNRCNIRLDGFRNEIYCNPKAYNMRIFEQVSPWEWDYKTKFKGSMLSTSKKNRLRKQNDRVLYSETEFNGTVRKHYKRQNKLSFWEQVGQLDAIVPF